ncbi:MAG: hypothetical protein AB1333_01080 [Patescibacteria group bacterium]
MIARIKKKIQTQAANLTALIVQGLFSSASTYVYEVVFFSIAEGKWIWIRLLYNGIKYATFFVPAKLDDYLRSTFLRTSQNKFYEFIADGLALSIHQIPIYVVSSFIFRIDIETIIFVSVIYLVDNFIFGWVYGSILKWMRENFVTKTA